MGKKKKKAAAAKKAPKASGAMPTKTKSPVSEAKLLARSAGDARPSPKKLVVLSIGLDKPVREIVEAAREEGVSVTPKYVNLLKQGRSSGRVPAKRGSKTRVGGAAKKMGKSARRGGDGPSKSELIRSMASASTDEILAAGKKKGLAFTKKYIAKVRYAARLAGQHAPKSAGLPSAKETAKSSRAASKKEERARNELRAALAAAQKAIGTLLAAL